MWVWVVMRLWIWVCGFGGWGLWWPSGWWFFFYGGGGWQWLAVGVAMTGVAWTEKKVVERERHSGKIKIILFK